MRLKLYILLLFAGLSLVLWAFAIVRCVENPRVILSDQVPMVPGLSLCVVVAIVSVLVKGRVARLRSRVLLLLLIAFFSAWLFAAYLHYAFNYWRILKAFEALPAASKAKWQSRWTPRWSDVGFDITVAGVAAVLSATSAIVARLIFRRLKPVLPGSCPRCRYDLTGNISGVCPECGTAVTERLMVLG